MVSKKVFSLTVFILQIVFWLTSIFMFMVNLKVLVAIFGVLALVFYTLFEIAVSSTFFDPIFREIDRKNKD